MTKIAWILFGVNTTDVVILYHICLTFRQDIMTGSQLS